RFWRQAGEATFRSAADAQAHRARLRGADAEGPGWGFPAGAAAVASRAAAEAFAKAGAAADAAGPAARTQPAIRYPLGVGPARPDGVAGKQKLQGEAYQPGKNSGCGHAREQERRHSLKRPVLSGSCPW
ncbi:unnamed protein product, partial [Prorocentrum cordatum]